MSEGDILSDRNLRSLPRGRRAGIKNNFTREIKAALARGGTIAGNRFAAANKVKSEGLATYFAWLAARHPALYTELLKGALPREVTGGGEDGEFEVVYRSIHEVQQALAERGLPMPEVYKLPYSEGAIIEEVAIEQKDETVLKG